MSIIFVQSEDLVFDIQNSYLEEAAKVWSRDLMTWFALHNTQNRSSHESCREEAVIAQLGSWSCHSALLARGCNSREALCEESCYKLSNCWELGDIMICVGGMRRRTVVEVRSCDFNNFAPSPQGDWSGTKWYCSCPYLHNVGKSQGFLFSAYPKCFLINFLPRTRTVFSSFNEHKCTTMNIFS